MRENLIEKRLVKGVFKLGGKAIKFVPTFFAGFPDRIVLMPGGRIAFVETKATGEKPRPLQVGVIGWLRKMGFRVDVLASFEEVDNYLKTL